MLFIVVCISISGLLFLLPAINQMLCAQAISQTVRYRILTLGSLVFPLLILSSYWYLGTYRSINIYNSKLYQERLVLNREMRGQFVALQFELLKARFGLLMDVKNVRLVLDYCEAQFMSLRGGEGMHLDVDVALQIRVLLTSILRVQPAQPMALNLLALDAYSEQEYAKALGYWQRLYDSMPEEMQARDAGKILVNKLQELRRLI